MYERAFACARRCREDDEFSCGCVHGLRIEKTKVAELNELALGV